MTILFDFLVHPNMRGVPVVDDSNAKLRKFLDKKINCSKFMQKYEDEDGDDEENEFAIEISDFTIRKALEKFPETVHQIFEENKIDGLIIQSEDERKIIAKMNADNAKFGSIKSQLLSVLNSLENEETKQSIKFMNLIADATKFYTPQGAQYVYKILGGIDLKHIYANIIFVIASVFRFVLSEYIQLSEINHARVKLAREKADTAISELISVNKIKRNINKAFYITDEANLLTFFLTRTWEKVLVDNKIKSLDYLDQNIVSEISLNMITAISKIMKEDKGLSKLTERERQKIIDSYATIISQHCEAPIGAFQFWKYLGFSEFNASNRITVGEKTFYNIIDSSIARKSSINVLSPRSKKNRIDFLNNIDYILYLLTFKNQFVKSAVWSTVYKIDPNGKMIKQNDQGVVNDDLSSIMKLSATALAEHSGLDRHTTTMKILKIAKDFVAYIINYFISKLVITKFIQSPAILAISNLIGFKYIANFLNQALGYLESSTIHTNKEYIKLYSTFNANISKIFTDDYATPRLDPNNPNKILGVEIDTRSNAYFTLIAKTIKRSLAKKKSSVEHLEKKDLAALTMILFNVCHPFMVKEAKGKLVYTFNEQGIDALALHLSRTISKHLQKSFSGSVTLSGDFDTLHLKCSIPVTYYLDQNSEIIHSGGSPRGDKTEVKDIINEKLADTKIDKYTMASSRISKKVEASITTPQSSPIIKPKTPSTRSKFATTAISHSLDSYKLGAKLNAHIRQIPKINTNLNNSDSELSQKSF